MPDNYRHLVIGRGIMGAAAAMHLAADSDSVAVLGPTEAMALADSGSRRRATTTQAATHIHWTKTRYGPSSERAP